MRVDDQAGPSGRLGIQPGDRYSGCLEPPLDQVEFCVTGPADEQHGWIWLVSARVLKCRPGALDAQAEHIATAG